MKQTLLFSIFILFFLSPIFSFSQMYKVDEQRIYDWDESIPDWKQISTRQYTYDNEGTKETNVLTLAFPSGDKLFQENKTYNANNDITLSVMQLWNPNPIPGAWQSSSQTMYAYDGSNKLMTETTESLFPGSQNKSQVVYQYDGGNLEMETTYFYNFGTLVFELTDNSTRELYEYSGSDISKETSQDYVPGTGMGTGTWADYEIYDLTYVSPGVISTVTESTWDSNTSMWEIERGTASYEMGLLAKIEYEVPDGMGGWDLDSQTLFDYMGDQLLDIRTHQDWDGSAWVDIDQELFEYDGNGNNSETIYEDASTGPWVGYYKEEKIITEAAPFSLTAKSIEKRNLKVYPNPALDYINISSSNNIEMVEIFNVLGNKIQSIVNSEKIDIKTLNAGVYILKIFSDNEISTKKVVIKN